MDDRKLIEMALSALYPLLLKDKRIPRDGYVNVLASIGDIHVARTVADSLRARIATSPQDDAS